ncbi:30S ribosome-binding factor RbfA [Falsarthrobacter nasiphocae]|uniref:Ribosome-binding factor A n=1 Tax=Falsarthrobacter nasiphocae TaxID=189863 RepID=A0AAE3YH72_9MICC|nr:30S ribosome-binding factor RbfA [Falsarthrobacter nasiphocae]MDR6892652.1 ribosome-binding factor A [Falsarthrobacter nasiphocae]
MADPARAAKLADRIKAIVARALETRIKDERLGFVTITDARVTNDLQHATVYYTVFGDEESKARSVAALEANRGRLRKAIGDNIRTRLTPTLTLVADEVPENAQAVEDLLRAARERDAEVASLAQGAEYAAGENPYKSDDEAEEDEH